MVASSNNYDQFELTLTDDEAKSITDGLSNIVYDPNGNQQYISKIRIAAYKCFPAKILNIFEEQRSNRKSPYLIINNVPIDNEVHGSPNAMETGSSFKNGCLSENVICAFGAIIGKPYSIHFEGAELVNNLTPQKASKQDYTGLGSEVELDFHIENAALKYMTEDDCSPMGMLLLGIRTDPKNIGPKTYLADSRKALELLSESDIAVLRQKNFIIRLPYRWRGVFNSYSENTDLCPIISGPKTEPNMSVAFYPDMVLPVNDRSKEAFNALYEAIKSVSVGVHITENKLVYLDNRFTLHAREKFKPTYDEQELPYRWVQRVFLTTNLWNFRQFSKKGERVFDPLVSESYQI